MLFLLLASNYLLVAYCGWVWFMAQCFSFVLSLMAIYYAIDDVPSHGALSLAFWALSVGCRPMQAVYLPLLLYLIYKKTGKNIKKYWYFAIAPCVIAAAFMALNYFRFGSVTEFGHNFLPEFLADPQFSPVYILQNVKNLFRLPLENGKISFPAFNGFAFYLVSPVFLSFACYGLRNIIWHKKGADKAVSIGVPILIAIHFLLLASHRTMGGWQWGNRYTIDALPYLFLAFLEVSRHRGWMRYLDYILFIFGITLNFYGTVLFFTGGI